MLKNTGRPARVGPVHWDPAGDRVQPFEDIHSPFVSLGHIEQAIAERTEEQRNSKGEWCIPEAQRL